MPRLIVVICAGIVATGLLAGFTSVMEAARLRSVPQAPLLALTETVEVRPTDTPPRLRQARRCRKRCRRLRQARRCRKRRRRLRQARRCRKRRRRLRRARHRRKRRRQARRRRLRRARRRRLRRACHRRACHRRARHRRKRRRQQRRCKSDSRRQLRDPSVRQHQRRLCLFLSRFPVLVHLSLAECR